MVPNLRCDPMAGDDHRQEPEADSRVRDLMGFYTELFSEVSHDLRGPVGVILGALGELQGEQMPPLDEEQRMLVGLVRRSATRLSHYATNLLELSRMDAGRFELHPQSQDFAAAVRGAIRYAEEVEHGHAVRVSVEAPSGGSEVHLDAERLHQLVANLVTRGLRSARRGVTVSVANGEGGVRMAVVDDGATPPAEVRDRLFELPRRPVGERGRRNIDLAVAGQLVRMQGGTIRAEEAEPSGLRIVVELPRRVG